MLNAKNNVIIGIQEKFTNCEKELGIKHMQIAEFEGRTNKTQDDLDIALYTINDNRKNMTSMKLTTEILTTTNESLVKEKNNLIAELKETR